MEKVKPTILSHLGDLKSILKMWFWGFGPTLVMGHFNHPALLCRQMSSYIFCSLDTSQGSLMLNAMTFCCPEDDLCSRPAPIPQPVPVLTVVSSSALCGLTQGLGRGFLQQMS